MGIHPKRKSIIQKKEMTRYPLTYEEFTSIYSRVPRLTVEVLIQTPQGILLTLRNLASWNNLWHLPGGTVYYGETVEEAVIRIASEEIGITVTPIKLIGYLHYPSEEKERGFGWSIGLVFTCDSASQPINLGEQASRYQFFKTLPENMVVEQKAFLETHILKSDG